LTYNSIFQRMVCINWATITVAQLISSIRMYVCVCVCMYVLVHICVYLCLYMLFNVRAAWHTNKWQIVCSDDMKRSIKLAIWISIWYLRGRKLNIFWHSVTISTEPVRNNFMKMRVNERSNECVYHVQKEDKLYVHYGNAHCISVLTTLQTWHMMTNWITRFCKLICILLLICLHKV